MTSQYSTLTVWHYSIVYWHSSTLHWKCDTPIQYSTLTLQYSSVTLWHCRTVYWQCDTPVQYSETLTLQYSTVTVSKFSTVQWQYDNPVQNIDNVWHSSTVQYSNYVTFPPKWQTARHPSFQCGNQRQTTFTLCPFDLGLCPVVTFDSLNIADGTMWKPGSNDSCPVPKLILPFLPMFNSVDTQQHSDISMDSVKYTASSLFRDKLRWQAVCLSVEGTATV